TQLASANSLVSAGTASSQSQVVTNRSDLLLSEGANQLGFSSLASAGGVALGTHNISVTQSSQAAEAVGTTDLQSAAGTTITTGSNDTVDVTLDGTAYQLTLGASPTGGYTSSGLLAAVNSAISAQGISGQLQAGYNSSGQLVLATTAQGSTQSLAVTGGSALASLGLATGSSTGADAVVSVDGNSTTFNDITAGSPITLFGASGDQYTATLPANGQQYADSSLISQGSVTATDVSAGSGSLADVVKNINAAGSGIIASAVQTGTNQYVLQLTSTTTGAKGDVSLDPTAFASSSLGQMKTAVAGQDAQLQVGGANGYTVSSADNTFAGLLPGLTINAQQVSSNPITVTVGADVDSIAGSVASFVSDANTVLSDLQKYAGYNSTTKVAGPLMGSAVLQNLTNQILQAVASVTGSSTFGNASNVGISISNGSLSFDKTAFENAYDANATNVQNLFTQGGKFSASSSPYTGQVGFSYATTTTKPGSYDVNVSHSATQASTLGSALSGSAVSAGETLSIAMGAGAASYTTSAGQSLSSIATGLNSAFAAQGMSLTAQVVDGNQLQLITSSYGSETSFSVSTDNNATGTLGLTGSSTAATYAGTDVVGTINGVAATGEGQFLSAPTTDPTLSGLSLQVTASGINSATDLGSFSYQPGLAQVLGSLADAMANPVSGAITTTVQSMQTQSINLNPQIAMYNQIVQSQQKILMAKYATMESNLESLKNQSSSLTSELASITANG
ncbi:MAG TPA: flagellar filament capping protein FliD, partial [Acidimicrobiales bacterium]|nr:flagellar filament capping protein FliD [Acidimicrobiales bacterium]